MDRPTDITGFDPYNTPDQESINSDMAVFDRLVQFSPTNTIIPMLATSWKYSNGGKSLTLTLRKGVRFSNGTPLTPADVIYSLKQASNPKGVYALYDGNDIKDIVAPNADQVRIDLHHQYGPLLSSLAIWQAGIESAANAEKLGTAGASTHPVGTGPYMLGTWDKGVQLTLVRNPHYWGRKPYLDSVVMKVVSDDTTRLLQLESGEANIIETVPPSEVKSLKGAGDQLEAVYGGQVVLIPLDLRFKPFQDQNVRLALSYALDRAAVAKDAYFGYATPALSDLASGISYYEPKFGIAYDLAKAKAYLAKSSLPHGFSFTLLVSAGNEAYNEMAQIWASSLAQIGVTAHIEQIDAATGYSRWMAEKYDAYIVAWTIGTPDAMEFSAFGFLGQDGFYTHYQPPGGAALVAQGTGTLNTATRQRVYQQIQSRMAKEQNILYAVNAPTTWASGATVHGFAPNEESDYKLENIWLSH
jgi:peptide/nickel transport system substrate-binding protein